MQDTSKSYDHLKGCPVGQNNTREFPNPTSGPYRDGWDKDIGYKGHPGEYSGWYSRYSRVTVDERR
jgi:hypothetical protein